MISHAQTCTSSLDAPRHTSANMSLKDTARSCNMPIVRLVDGARVETRAARVSKAARDDNTSELGVPLPIGTVKGTWDRQGKHEDYVGNSHTVHDSRRSKTTPT